MSSGLGPFYASSSLGGGRRRGSTSTHRRASPSRPVAPSAAQWERARRQAERAQQEAQREAAIAELRELRRRTTSVHLQSFPVAAQPAVPAPPLLGLPWALAQATAFHLRGVGRLARGERAAARSAAGMDAPAFLAEEQARLQAAYGELCSGAERWWRSLNANDEAVVCEAVNTAFSDNPASGCAVGVQGSVMSVVMRQQDLDSLPAQTAGVTSGGRPTLKALTKRDRTLWWLTAMGSNVVATLKEGFATAPGITAIDLAVLTRMPETQRLGFVAYGRWSRNAIENAMWRQPEDALRFLDIGQDVACSVTTTASGNLSSTIKPLDTSRLPGLQALLDHAHDDADSGSTSLGDLDTSLSTQPTVSAPVTDPFRLRTFAEWKTQTASLPAPPTPLPPLPHGPAPVPTVLVPGQNTVLPEEASQELSLAFTFTGADADLTLLLLGADGRVTSDEDFVFYNQPSAAAGAARLLGKQAEGDHIVERATVHLAALPQHIHRIAVSINMDVEAALTCASLTHSALSLQSPLSAAWAFTAPTDPRIRAMVVAELYRHTVDGQAVWKLRAVGQGWADGLDGLVRAHGVHTE